MKHESLIASLITERTTATEKLAEQAGYDAGVNGSNTVNSHFKWFMAPHLTKAWERGKKRADAAKEPS